MEEVAKTIFRTVLISLFITSADLTKATEGETGRGLAVTSACKTVGTDAPKLAASGGEDDESEADLHIADGKDGEDGATAAAGCPPAAPPGDRLPPRGRDP